MKSVVSLLFISLMLIGCSNSVKKGSWYQNIKTGEKIKIEDVGTGKEIEDRLKRYGGGKYWYVSGADIYKYDKSFAYITETKDTPPVFHIESIKRLEEDYLKIK